MNENGAHGDGYPSAAFAVRGRTGGDSLSQKINKKLFVNLNNASGTGTLDQAHQKGKG